MTDHLKFYIDGQWVEPHGKGTLDVVNPATEEPIGKIALGDATDVDRAVAAARKAFETFSRTSREDRLALLERVLAVYKERAAELAAAVTQEMGAPVKLANAAQVPSGIGHFMATIRALKEYQFEHDIGTTRVVREPIGVVGMITPWNWPLNQITCKVAPAPGAPWCSRPRRSPRSTRSSSRRSCMTPACRPGCSTWSTATARRSAPP
jgi:aldehyde dehydrogenase (NAD+)